MSRLLLLFLLTAALTVGTKNVQAQEAATEPTVRLSPTQAAHFQQALDALAAQGHIAIVAEGVPLASTLKKADTSDVSVATPLETAVSEIAESYDYDVARKGGLFIFKKRYTNPRDLPSVTLQELQLDLADAIAIMSPLSPNIPHSIRTDIVGQIRDDFLATLSSQQYQAMQAKTLHLGDLAPAQQDIIKRLMAYEYVQMPLMPVKVALNRLMQVPKAALLTSDERGTTGLYLETTIFFDDDPTLPQRELTNLAGRSAVNRYPVILPSVKPQPQAEAGTTLERVVADLNAASHASGTSLMTVEPALQEKQVSVAGINNAAPNRVLSALASVYGLRIGVNDANGPKLARQGVLMPAKYTDMASALWRSLPEPYLRAVHYTEIVSHDPILPGPGDLRDPAKMKAIYERERTNMMRPSEIQALPGELSKAAVLQLLAQLQPQLKTLSAGGRLPVASLTSGARSLVGLALVGEAIGTLTDHLSDQYNAPVRRCLEDFDHIVVYGNPYEDPFHKGRMTHSLLMEGRDPLTGNIVGMGGVG